MMMVREALDPNAPRTDSDDLSGRRDRASSGIGTAYTTIAYAWYCPSTLDVIRAILPGRPRSGSFWHDHRQALRDAIEAQEAALASEPDAKIGGYITERIVSLRELEEAL
jgi:hypothetical protein